MPEILDGGFRQKFNPELKTETAGPTAVHTFMAKQDDKLVLDAEVEEALPNAMFKVKLPNDQSVLAYVSGKMRKHFIRILPGDRVTVEISPYDLTKARITYRH